MILARLVLLAAIAANVYLVRLAVQRAVARMVAAMLPTDELRAVADQAMKASPERVRIGVALMLADAGLVWLAILGLALGRFL